jgi:hypothetical protein
MGKRAFIFPGFLGFFFVDTSPAQSDEEGRSVPSLATMVFERGTNMDQGRDAKILALLADNGIDTWEKFEKSVLAYATKRDALREGFYRFIKKGIKLGLWEAPSRILPAKSRATAIPIAFALAWISTLTGDALKRNTINAKYNPQEIPERESYYAKAVRVAVQLATDIPAIFLPGKGAHVVGTLVQMGASFGSAYALNNRKAVGEIPFLDGDHPERLEALLDRRKKSNPRAFGEYVIKDLLTVPSQVPRALVTATISPKMWIKTFANVPVTLGLTFVPSDDVARIIRDASSLPKKILKKQIKKGLDYLEQHGYCSYTHKRAGKIADACVDPIVAPIWNLARRTYSWLRSSTATADERRPLLAAVTAAEEGAAPASPAVEADSAAVEPSIPPPGVPASQQPSRPGAPRSDTRCVKASSGAEAGPSTERTAPASAAPDDEQSSHSPRASVKSLTSARGRALTPSPLPRDRSGSQASGSGGELNAVVTQARRSHSAPPERSGPKYRSPVPSASR